MSEHGQAHAHVYVSGHVQGIYYRATARGTARDHDVGGWAKSLLDDRAEAVFEGPHDDMKAMVEWCHEGSPMAAVEDVDVTFEEPNGETGFRIER